MEIVDLSVELGHHMPRYPSAHLPEVELIPVATHEADGRSAQKLVCGTHVSTHLDAPFHGCPDGETIDQIDLSRLVGPARIVRLPGKTKDHPIEPEDLSDIPGLDQEERIVFDTGWLESTWGTAEYFTDGTYLTRAAASFLAGFPKLKLLAMDFANIDSVSDMVKGQAAPNHSIILGRNILLLENLDNLSRLPERFLLLAMPPKLTGGDGCPCRVAGVHPIEESANWSLNGSPR